MEPWHLWNLRTGSMQALQRADLPSSQWSPRAGHRTIERTASEVIIREAGGQPLYRLQSSEPAVERMWLSGYPMLALGSDGSVRHVSTGRLLDQLPAEGAKIISAVPLNQSLAFYVLLSDGRVLRTDGQQVEAIVRFNFSELNPPQDLTISKDNRYLYVCCGSHYGGTLMKYDLWERRSIWQTPADGNVLTLSEPGEDRIVCGRTIHHASVVFSTSGTVRVYNAGNGEVLSQDIYGEAILAVAYNPRLGVVCLARGNGDVELREPEHLQLLACLRADSQGCTHAVRHPSLPIVATCGASGMLRIWDLQNYSLVYEKPVSVRLAGLRFSEDGQHLMVATSEPAFSLYSLENFATDEVLKRPFAKTLDDPVKVLAQMAPSRIEGPCPSRAEADACYHAKNWRAAMQAALRRLQEHPREPSDWALLGRSLSNLRSFEDAAQVFRMAIRLDNTDASSRANLAVALYHLGHLAEALETLNAYLDVEPHNEKAEAMRNKIRDQLRAGGR